MWLNPDNRYRLARWAAKYYAIYGKTCHPRQPYVVTTSKGWTPEQSEKLRQKTKVVRLRRKS